MTHGRIVSVVTLLSLISFGTVSLGWTQAGPAGPSTDSGNNQGSNSQQPSPAAGLGTGGSSSSSSAGVSMGLGQSDFQGSVPQGTASSTPLPLTLGDAITRGLRANLGLLVSQQSNNQSRAQRLRSLSALLPQIKGDIYETVLQENLAALGFTNFPGSSINFPSIIGPFAYSTAEAQANIPIVNWSNIQNYRASRERVKSAELSVKDARDLVVLAVGNAYLRIVASAAQVASIQAQVNTDQTLFNRAKDQKLAGVSPGIDVLRAQVQLQSQQQALVVEKNQFEKDKLTLARVIGLPIGQEFNVADPTPSLPLEAVNLDEALTKAYANRSDYRAAQSQVRAAELSVKAAKAERYPTLGAQGYYGDQGLTFGNSHGVFQAAVSLNFNIFDGGRIKSDVQQQQVDLNNSRNRLENLKGQIDFDVRNALLDLKASNEQVSVAKSNAELANQTLGQAQDRFAAGVADNLEVVQAQQSVASASQSLISALYQNNVAKVELARALGLAEEGIRTYFQQNPEKH
jgi:outer membrane protein TolC